MKKITPVLLVSTIALAILLLALLGGGIWYFVIFSDQSPNTSSYTDPSSQARSPETIADVPPLSRQQIDANPYYLESEHILQQITSLTDEYGFYGAGQICQPGTPNYACQIYLTAGSDRANWRETLAVIWGRYQHYLATGSDEQRRLLEQDVDNLITKVVDEGYLLQSRNFNCLWMEPLLDSPYLSTKTKQQATRLCLDAPFEYAPNSSVAFDQHRHNYYVVTDVVEGEENQPVIGVSMNNPPEEDLITVYEPADLVAHITQNLHQAAAGGDISSYSVVAAADQLDYFTREISAALDQIGAMRVAEAKGDTAKYDAALLHYLLLLDEVLLWYHVNEPAVSPEDKCLLSVALDYFTQTYQPEFTGEEAMTLANLYEVVNPGAMCTFARSAIFGTPADLPLFLSYLDELNPADWTNGGLLVSNSIGEWLYPTDLNATLAGLFATKESQP